MVNRAYILLFVLCIQFGPSLQRRKKLRKRLDNMEVMLDHVSVKTQSDISELRDAIVLLNNTKMKEEVQAVKSELMETKEMNSKLKKEVEENKEDILELRQMIMEMEQTKNGYSSAVVTVPVDTSSATALPVSTHVPSTVVPVPAHLPTCPDGWLKFQDTCYLHVKNDRVSWDVAETRCAKRGGFLAEPDTEEKMRYLFSLRHYHTWIGGTDRRSEGTWMWSGSKKNITFFLWAPGQPNNDKGDQGQDCLEILVQLNDVNCAKQQSYICEKQANV